MLSYNTPIGDSKYFTWKEALWLPTWARTAVEADGLTLGAMRNIRAFVEQGLDPIRELVGVPFEVHCFYRPPIYNKEVGGAPGSAHQAIGTYAAVDFHPRYPGLGIPESCQKAVELIKPVLAQYKLRMEDNGPDSMWIHLDNKPTEDQYRFFKP